MTLNTIGPISLIGSTTGQSVAVELGLSPTGQLSLQDSRVRTLAGVPSGAIVMPTNLYGKFQAFSVTAWGIGAGGQSTSDTRGGAGGGGAVIRTFTISPSGITSCNVNVGARGGLGSTGGSSSLVTSSFTITASGGQPGSAVPCGGCAGPNVNGGSGSNGDINLTGGYGMGWNQRNGDGSAINGGNGGTSGGYYAAGGGGGGNDYGSQGSGGLGGGTYAGNGGFGVRTGRGGNATNYGGGSGGSGNNGAQPGTAANGVFVLRYTSSKQLASGGTVSFSGGVWTHVFTSSGVFAAL